jgi:anti-anti-sigma regulatory factor
MTLHQDVPVRPWDEMLIDDIDAPADLPARRRLAVAEAVAHARPATPDGCGALGVRRYGSGCIALALRGRFDRGARELLQALSDEVPYLARRELAIDFSGLERCDGTLARAIGRLRIRCLTREARVELYDPPPALAVELGRPVGARDR